MPRPVQSAAAVLAAAPAPAQSAAVSSRSRGDAQQSLLLTSPRFREALHKASRKPEPKQPAAERSPAEPSASANAKKSSGTAKAGSSRRAAGHAGRGEDYGEGDVAG